MLQRKLPYYASASSIIFCISSISLRLCLPFSIRSAWSLVPSEKILDYETAQYAAKPEITSGIAALNRAVNPAFGESFAATPAASVNPLQVWMHLAGIVWAVGVLALLLAALVSVWKLRRRVQAHGRLHFRLQHIPWHHIGRLRPGRRRPKAEPQRRLRLRQQLHRQG